MCCLILKNKFSLPAIIHKTITTFGVGESFLAQKLVAFEELFPEHIKLAYLPSFGTVKLRLTVRENDDKQTNSLLNYYFNIL